MNYEKFRLLMLLDKDDRLFQWVESDGETTWYEPQHVSTPNKLWAVHEGMLLSKYKEPAETPIDMMLPYLLNDDENIRIYLFEYEKGIKSQGTDCRTGKVLTNNLDSSSHLARCLCYEGLYA